MGWSGSGLQIAAVCLPALGAALLVLSLTAVELTKRIYVAWMSVATPIGIVMSTLMLTVLYFVLLPVFSLIVRRADPLRKRLSDADRYWEDYKPHEATLERMRRPF